MRYKLINSTKKAEISRRAVFNIWQGEGGGVLSSAKRQVTQGVLALEKWGSVSYVKNA